MTELTQCPNFHALAVTERAHEGYRFIARLRCKQWTCPYCAPKNRAIWRAKLIHHINATQGAWSWFTLTAHGKMRGELLSLKNLRGAWDKIMKRLKRKYGAFSYARIYEKHQDGSYHIHAIASFAFDDIRERQSEDGEITNYSSGLAEDASELSLGWYTHADNISQEFAAHSGYIASYITKYIVKLDTQTKTELGRVRHIQTSQNWITKAKEEQLEKWMFKFGIYYDDIIDLDAGTGYIDITTGHKVSLADFEDTYIYPPEFDDRQDTT